MNDFADDDVPRLRDDLRIRRGPNRTTAAGVIEDPTFRHNIKLDLNAWRVVNGIDGQRDVSGILRHANLSGRPRLSRETVDAVLGFLRRAALLDEGALPATRPALIGTQTLRVSKPTPVRLRFLQDARFACSGSGMCCGGYVYGPIEPEVIQAVRQHEFRKNRAIINQADPFESTVDAAGKPMQVLRQHQGRCVFLSDDRQCLIQRELGPEAKPGICRVYPLRFALAPDGECFVRINMECGGFARGRHGPLLKDRADEIAELARRFPDFRVDEQVRLDARRTCSYADSKPLEQSWLDDLARQDAPIGAELRRMARRLYDFTPGGHPAAVRAPAESALLPAGPAVSELMHRIFVLASQAAKGHMDAGRMLPAELHMRVRLAAALVLGDDNAVGADLWPVAARVWREPPGSVAADAGDDVLRLQLRNAVFGKVLHQAPDLELGLGFLCLNTALASALAAVMVAHTGQQRCTSEHVTEGMRVVNRCLRPSALVTLDAEPSLRAWVGALAVDAG